ncbi:hypothetical protein CXG81DRAFT_29585 [Caulochytrium protostelioides]|uniref:DUF814-domain-containing protein n=1 Tax=Caulochytrium protostelioides TaxID=1555241 RepID=A0A4P9X9Y0_9FUNG|nr:DUF814-domain-containing protein [Caulochytrium protostelioides]RKP02126.1 hypothetical protein CXG81DRAFT_29585 [Caulochytrium protostelioides]|eukprot:RKP02126.1 hypothetical protein CXG81DRAFT_29585 [Caulochytrium protostelioides]
MVYFFTSTSVDPPAEIYVGKDKYENDEILKYGSDRDVWFHVDKLSSAHVYYRLRADEKWDELPQPLLDDLAQLTKANSIEGDKQDNIKIIYTPWSNLNKPGDLAVGQVMFHQSSKVKRIHVAKRINAVVSRLNKTRVERFPDHAKELAQREQEAKRLARVARNEAKARASAAKHEQEERRKEVEARSYDLLFDETQMTSNRNKNLGNKSIAELEEDFM